MADTPGDFFEQIADVGTDLQPKMLQRLRDAVENSGKKTTRIRCRACGEPNDVTVEVADVEETRKIIELFGSMQLRAAAQKKGDDSSRRAKDVLREINDMTNEQLAEAIAALREELQ